MSLQKGARVKRATTVTAYGSQDVGIVVGLVPELGGVVVLWPTARETVAIRDLIQVCRACGRPDDLHIAGCCLPGGKRV